MKKFVSLLFLSLTSSILFAQSLNNIAKETSPGWYKVKPDVAFEIDDFMGQGVELLNLGAHHSFKTVRLDQDDLGYTHVRLQQQYKNVDIEAGDFILHAAQRQLEQSIHQIQSMNGKLVRDLNLSVQPGISARTAFKQALNYVGAQKYIWEEEANEAMLQDLHDDPQASYKPKAELVIAQENFNQKGSDYRLMYKLDVYAVKPLSRQDIYVDAQTGEVVFTLDKIHTGDVPGVAHTKYTGVQNIITDSIGPELYRLRESTTGGGIETYNMLRTRDYSQAVDFLDSNNVWDNFNAFQDEVATDAHWGAQTTYNYFYQMHGRDSYDNKGTKLLNYVHYDQNFVNAFWDGQRMTYGDGNGSSFFPLISLDIAAHEMTHGVTQFSAGLIYLNEYGALNESFSDIFAAAVEYYGDPANFDYRVGEDMTADSLGIRSMKDPKSMGDPDTYLAGIWYTGQLDNGGVHINSGVQNYWYYIMSAGDSGTNDLGVNYNVAGLGVDKASQIAYRNLAYYLTRTSEYNDARAGSMQAAEDLYGICSPEMITTVEAWYAVGVGRPLQDEDFVLVDVLSPETSCGLGSAEAVSLLIRYYDCNDTLLAGESLSVAYQLDNQSPVNETVIIPQNMVAGDTLIYTFNQTVNVSAFTTYNLQAWINYSDDLEPLNDTLTNVSISNSFQQNSDFAVVDMPLPRSGCALTTFETVEVSYRFLGCDSLVAGQSIDVNYRLNGQPAVTETVNLSATLYPEDVMVHAFANSIDLSAKDQYAFDVWVNYTGDPESANDSILNRAIQNPYSIQDKLFTFENRSTTLDSMYFSTTANSKIDFYLGAAVTDTLGLRFTGANALATLPDFPVFNRRDPWSIYPEYSSFACACVDARDWDSVKVSFDLKQTYSRVWRDVTLRDNKGVSSFRVLADGNQIGDTYQALTNDKDRFRSYELNLRDYAKTQFELCLEARNFLAEEYDYFANSEGDNAYVDKLKIFNDGNIGLRENATSIQQIRVFPNPSKGVFTIELELNDKLNTTYSVYTSTGKLVQSASLNLSNGYHQLDLDLKNYPVGMYILELNGESEKLWITK